MFQNEKKQNLKGFFGEDRAKEIEQALLSISSNINSVATEDTKLIQSLKTIVEDIYALKQFAVLSDIWNVFKLLSPTCVANMDLAKTFCESRAMQEKDVINLITIIKLLYVDSL